MTIWSYHNFAQNCQILFCDRFKHAKRGTSGPFHQKVKTWKLSGIMFFSKTQGHVSRKPITNEIFLSFLTAIYIYMSLYKGYGLKRPKRSYDLESRPQPWLEPRLSLKTMEQWPKVTARPWLNDHINLLRRKHEPKSWR